MKYLVFVLFFIFQLLSNLSYAQSTTCRQLMDQALEQKRKRAYTEALKNAQKYVRCNKKKISGTEYYNIARMASLAGHQKMAIQYLKKATKLGFYDVKNMEQERDLKTLKSHKKYSAILAKARKNNRSFKSKLGFDQTLADKIAVAIPYQKDEKWGWLDRESLQPLTKAIFDYTDFSTGGKLVFILDKQVYHYTAKGVVEKAKTYGNGYHTNNKQKIGKSQRATVPYKSLKIDGFELDEKGDLYSHSIQYKSIDLIKEDNDVYGKRLAIVTNKKGLYGVIDKNGNPLPNLEIKHSSIQFYGKDGNTDLFAVKHKRGQKVVIYDENGEMVYDKPIDYYAFIRPVQVDPSGSLVYVGRNSYVVASNNNKLRVIHKKTFQRILPKEYDQIELFNGPTENKTKSSRKTKRGTSPFIEDYFLVKEENSLFYVDKKGVEYKVN